MNHILDEEKIEKRIKDFYKTLLNRDADIEGLNHYTKLVQKNRKNISQHRCFSKLRRNFPCKRINRLYTKGF